MVPEFNAVDREAPAGIQEREKLHKRKMKMAEEAGAAPAVPDEGNTCLANKRDDLASRLSSVKGIRWLKWWCLRRESHPHSARFELAASAIGLRRRDDEMSRYSQPDSHRH
jgi:hypothetical protein